MATHSSGLENSMDRGNWQATVHRAAKELDITKQLSLSSKENIWVLLKKTETP